MTTNEMNEQNDVCEQNETRHYNLYELREENMGAVTNAIQVLQKVEPQEARAQAEAYITTAFHRAALVTTARLVLVKTGAALMTAINGGAAVLSTLNLMEGRGPWVGNAIALGIQAVGTFFSPLIYCAHRKVEMGLRNQIESENGYEPDPYASGSHTAYMRARDDIDALVARAQRRANVPAMDV